MIRQSDNLSEILGQIGKFIGNNEKCPLQFIALILSLYREEKKMRNNKGINLSTGPASL